MANQGYQSFTIALGFDSIARAVQLKSEGQPVTHPDLRPDEQKCEVHLVLRGSRVDGTYHAYSFSAGPGGLSIRDLGSTSAAFDPANPSPPDQVQLQVAAGGTGLHPFIPGNSGARLSLAEFFDEPDGHCVAYAVAVNWYCNTTDHCWHKRISDGAGGQVDVATPYAC